MRPAEEAMMPIYCDGCGREASDEHLRRRIARLEWASRFRPIHIDTLILTPEPPEEIEDFFYFPEEWPQDPEARAFQEDLLESSGISQKRANSREGGLLSFQQAGYFLAHWVECPAGLSGFEEFDAMARQLRPAVERRIRFSYRPKAILLVSERLTEAAKALGGEGLEGRLLVMRDGEPVPVPISSDSEGRARFRTKVASLLNQAASGGG